MTKVAYVNPENSVPAQGLYSHVGVVEAGKQAFIAGQLSVDMKGAVVGKNDFAAQFKQIFENLGDVLKGLGTDYSGVIRFTTYLVHSQDIEKFMALRAELFPRIFKDGKYPPNTLLVVDRLVKEDFILEVDTVAAL